MFEYGNPEAILTLLPGAPNDLGHAPVDGFDHFCSVTGCPHDDAWAKLAIVWSKTAQRD